MRFLKSHRALGETSAAANGKLARSSRERSLAGDDAAQQLRALHRTGDDVVVVRTAQDQTGAMLLDVAAGPFAVVDAAHTERLAMFAAGTRDRSVRRLHLAMPDLP